MLATEQMSRVLIVGQRDLMAPVITELQRQRLFHIEAFVEDEREENEGFRIGVPLEGAGETSERLLRIRSITAAFSVRPEDFSPAKRVRESELKAEIEQGLPAIEKEVKDLLSGRTDLENRGKELDQKIEALAPFADMPVDLALLRGYENLTFFSGYISKKLEPAVPHDSFYSETKRGRLLVLAVPAAYRQDIERKLLDAQFQAVPIPDEEGTATERMDEYRAQREQVQTELAGISGKLEDLRKKHSEFLVACDELLSLDAERSEAPLRFATTDHAFIAEGWVPTHLAGTLRERVLAVTDNRVFVADQEADREKDHPPIEFDNIDFAKPTQLLMDVYSRPKYTEVDPTLFVAIAFPIFFGLILGDVGYGVVMLVASFVLRRFLKGFEEAGMLLTVVRNCAVSSIVFGFLYSEFLGFAIPGLDSTLPSRHLNIGVTDHGYVHDPAIPELLIMTAWVGIVYITLGRMLGILNYARYGHGSHKVIGILANVGWIMVMWGILFMLWSAFPMPLMPDLTGFPAIIGGFSIPFIIGAVLLVVGTVFIVRESVLELVELPTVLSHVLSFARLMGVGLSSVAIAMVINFITIDLMIKPHLEQFSIIGVLFILFGILVFIFGHLFNIVLKLLIGGLQCLRLNYIEFFTKFYKGGGEKYNPFGMKRRFMED